MSEIDEDFARLVRGGTADFRRTASCKYCGATNLQWQQENGRWILVYLEDGSKHLCRAKREDE